MLTSPSGSQGGTIKSRITGGAVVLIVALIGCSAPPPAAHEERTAPAVPTGETSTANAAQTAESPTPTVDPSDLDPMTYQAISPRDFAILAKDPDSARGRKIVIYGAVTQSDAAMGNKAFRATVMGRPHADHVYQINSVVEANDPTVIANVVEGDQVTMYVKVGGTTTYYTQLGGKATVPLFLVNVITVTAHIDR